ncbi:unnamed protein product [Aureobasidium pullulans]|nr:unnamed protein product [Aureobasidium pullulans]
MFTGVDGAADLVNHIGENHVGHDDEYNPAATGARAVGRCDYRTKELRELNRHKKKREHQ